jgi:tetrahydromethanopterin S-methyltransferase subunit H
LALVWVNPSGVVLALVWVMGGIPSGVVGLGLDQVRAVHHGLLALVWVRLGQSIRSCLGIGLGHGSQSIRGCWRWFGSWRAVHQGLLALVWPVMEGSPSGGVGIGLGHGEQSIRGCWHWFGSGRAEQIPFILTWQTTCIIMFTPARDFLLEDYNPLSKCQQSFPLILITKKVWTFHLVYKQA